MPENNDIWFSASQIDTYDLCARKWAWKYINGIETTPKDAVRLGLEIHEQLEGWLSRGHALDMLTEAGQIAMSGLHCLPPPGTDGLLVEEPFGIEMGGFKFRGVKDFQILDRQPPLVGDHKTTKDFRWAKTADELRINTQACLYALDAMFRTGAIECDLYWIYYRTQGSKQSKTVHLRVTREDITPTLEKMINSCGEMSSLLNTGLRAENIPINANACESFGGCEYMNLCNLTPQERMRSIMTQQKMSDFLQKMHQQNGINPPLLGGAAPTTSVPIPNIEPSPPIPVRDPQTGQWVLPQIAAAPVQVEQPPTPVRDPQTGQWIIPVAEPPPMSAVFDVIQAVQAASMQVPVQAVQAPMQVPVQIKAAAPTQVVQPPASTQPILVTPAAKATRGPGRPKKNITATIASPITLSTSGPSLSMVLAQLSAVLDQVSLISRTISQLAEKIESDSSDSSENDE